MVVDEEEQQQEKVLYQEQQLFAVQESDCCGNGCTNCILDNRPKPSKRVLLAGKQNIILNYTKFRLIGKESHPSDDQVLLLHLADDGEDEAEDKVLDIPPGHHVMLRVGSLLRPYSPYWSDFQRREFRILVKLQPEGPMSRHLAAVQLNDLLEFRGPIGNYTNDLSLTKCIFILTQGVAIAPTMPLVRAVLENEEDMSRIWHLVCARDLEHVFFREELLEFGQNWNYKSCLYLPHQLCDSPACQVAGHCGKECQELRRSLRYKEVAKVARLNASELASHANPTIPGQRVLIVAGDAGFQKAMKELAIQALGVDPDNVYLL